MSRKNNSLKANLTRSSIKLSIPVKKQNEAFDLLESVLEQTKFGPNCLHVRLYREANKEGTIMIEELWSSTEDLQRHLKSDAYHRILLAIEMADAPPEIRFDKIIESSGIETILKARSCPFHFKP